MATINISKLVLYDNWPGVPMPHAVYPNRTKGCGTAGKGWDNTVDNYSSADETTRALNASAAKAGHNRTRIGEKRQAYHESTENPGYYTMMYLCLHSFEDGMDISYDFSDGHFFHASGLGLLCISTTEWADTSRAPWFVTSRCITGNDMSKSGGPVAIFCSTYTYSDGTVVATQGYGDGYGWAWVGGVCPIKDVTMFDNKADGAGKGFDFTCDEDIHKGPVFLCSTGAAAWLMSADESNIHDLTTGVTLSDPGALAIGWVCDSAA